MKKILSVCLVIAVGAIGCYSSHFLRGQDNDGGSSTTTTTHDGGSGGTGGNSAGNGGSGGTTTTTTTTSETGGSGGTGGDQNCTPGETKPCTTMCGTIGIRGCTVNGVWAGCAPPAEICDGIDNDCNGEVDEGGVCTLQCVIQNPIPCAIGAYGCSYAEGQDSICTADLDGPGGEPAYMLWCECPKPGTSLGSYVSFGTPCTDPVICHNQ